MWCTAAEKVCGWRRRSGIENWEDFTVVGSQTAGECPATMKNPRCRISLKFSAWWQGVACPCLLHAPCSISFPGRPHLRVERPSPPRRLQPARKPVALHVSYYWNGRGQGGRRRKQRRSFWLSGFQSVDAPPPEFRSQKCLFGT